MAGLQNRSVDPAFQSGSQPVVLGRPMSREHSLRHLAEHDQSLSPPGASGRLIDAHTTHLASLSAVTWDFMLVGRTRMLTHEWLRSAQPTTFVQAPSLRSGLQRLTGRFRPPPPPHVVRPWPAWPARLWPLLPSGAIEFAARRQARLLRRELDRHIDWSAAVAVVISPIWAPWLDELPFARVIYDCIDDVAVHAPNPKISALVRRWEDDLLDKADAAVVTAEPLMNDIRGRRPSLPITLIRNGVDVDAFQSIAQTSPRPADVPALGRPIIGFVGALYEWIDWALIERAAAELTDCEFVFVGPQRRDETAERLVQRANVHFLGPRPYADVPAYMQAFDICWVPFDHSRVSRAANPVKIYEYLALGKPVVTTPVAGTEPAGGLLRVGASSDEIIEHLRACLSDSEPLAEQRVKFACANSWTVRANQYIDFVREIAAAPGPTEARTQ